LVAAGADFDAPAALFAAVAAGFAADAVLPPAVPLAAVAAGLAADAVLPPAAGLDAVGDEFVDVAAGFAALSVDVAALLAGFAALLAGLDAGFAAFWPLAPEPLALDDAEPSVPVPVEDAAAPVAATAATPAIPAAAVVPAPLVAAEDVVVSDASADKSRGPVGPGAASRHPSHKKMAVINATMAPMMKDAKPAKSNTSNDTRNATKPNKAATAMMPKPFGAVSFIIKPYPVPCQRSDDLRQNCTNLRRGLTT